MSKKELNSKSRNLTRYGYDLNSRRKKLLLKYVLLSAFRKGNIENKVILFNKIGFVKLIKALENE